MSDTLAPLAAVEEYLTFWNTPDPAQQQRLAARLFGPGLRYTAPIGVLEGAEALVDFRRQFTAHTGEAEFAARATPDAHHDRARLQWEIRLPDGSVFATGTDVLMLDGDRITAVTTFLDRAPDGFTPHEDHT